MIYLPIPVMMSEALTQLGFVFLDNQSWKNNCFWFTIDLFQQKLMMRKNFVLLHEGKHTSPGNFSFGSVKLKIIHQHQG